MSKLTIQNLQVQGSGKPILSDVSLTAGEGEFIGLIGPNGAGKTTLLRALLGFVHSQGKITLDDRDLLHFGETDRAKHIAYLPQEREVAWPVSVREVVTLGRRAIKPGFVGLDKSDQAAIEDAMAAMDVSALSRRKVNELSGGEKARVLIARVLAQNTPVILADEPVAGLDPAHQLGLMESFAALASKGRTILASFHELGLAASYCTRLVLLNQGNVIADGKPDEVLTLELIRQAYGIDAHIMKLDGQLIVQPKVRLSL